MRLRIRFLLAEEQRSPARQTVMTALDHLKENLSRETSTTLHSPHNQYSAPSTAFFKKGKKKIQPTLPSRSLQTSVGYYISARPNNCHSYNSEVFFIFLSFFSPFVSSLSAWNRLGPLFRFRTSEVFEVGRKKVYIRHLNLKKSLH